MSGVPAHRSLQAASLSLMPCVSSTVGDIRTCAAIAFDSTGADISSSITVKDVTQCGGRCVVHRSGLH